MAILPFSINNPIIDPESERIRRDTAKTDIEDFFKVIGSSASGAVSKVADMLDTVTSAGYDKSEPGLLKNISNKASDIQENFRSSISDRGKKDIIPAETSQDFLKAIGIDVKSRENLSKIEGIIPKTISGAKNIGKGVLEGGTNLLGNISNPEVVTTMGLAGSLGAVPATAIGLSYLPEIIGSSYNKAKEAFKPNMELGERAKNITEALGEGYFAKQIGKGAIKTALPRALSPKVIERLSTERGSLGDTEIKPRNLLSKPSDKVDLSELSLPKNYEKVKAREAAWKDNEVIFDQYKKSLKDPATYGDPTELKSELKKRYLNSLKQYGVEAKPKEALVNWTNNFLDTVDNANLVLQKANIDTSPILDFIDVTNLKANTNAKLREDFNLKEVAKLAKKYRINSNSLTDLMEYINVDSSGKPYFDPTALKKISNGKELQNIKAFKGNVPPEDLLKALYKTRSAYESGYKKLVESQPVEKQADIGYLNRYMPRKDLIPQYNYTKGLTDVYNPASLKPRSAKNTRLQRDFFKLTNSYINEISRASLPKYTETLKNMEALNMQLRFSGMDDIADMFQKNLEKSVGYRDPDTMTKVKTKVIRDMTDKEITNTLRSMGLEQTVPQKVANEISSQMMHALIGLNPKNLFAQSIQYLTSGGPELGLRNIVETKIKPYTKSELKLLEEVTPYLREPYFDPMESGKGLESPKKNLVSEVFKAPGKLGMKGQDIFDISGRKIVFMTAYKNFLKNPKKAMATMTEAQKYKISNVAKKFGREAAAKEFGIEKQKFIMNIFSNFNKPMVLKNEVTQYIPFTNYTRGEFSKLIKNITNAKENSAHRGELIKRVAYPMAVGIMYSLITGNPNDAWYFQPTAGVPRLLSPTIMPTVGGVVENTYQGPKSTMKNAMNATALTRLPLLLDKWFGEDKKKKIPSKTLKDMKPKFKSFKTIKGPKGF